MNNEICAAASPERWVSSKLQCGLGNRLFQLAAAHKLAEQWSVPLVFAMPYCRPSEHGDFDTIFKLFPDIPKLWKAEPLMAIDQGCCFRVPPLPTVAPADRTLLRGFWQDAKCVSDSFKPSWSAVQITWRHHTRMQLQAKQRCCIAYTSNTRSSYQHRRERRGATTRT